MGKQYYYFVTSLPTLFLNENLPVRENDFLSACKENLRKSDYGMLSSIDLSDVENDKAPSSIVRRFFSWECGVRNALVRLRAERLGYVPDEFLRGKISDISQTHLAEKAFNADSPLLAEEILNKARWKYLEELEFEHYFDIERLVIYLIKLRILERISLFDAVKGQEKLNAVVMQGAPDSD